MTLTGGNLIATDSNASNAGVRGTGSHDSTLGGKYQLQFTNVTLVDSLDYIGIGIAADTLGLAQGTQIQCILIPNGTSFSGDGAGGSNSLASSATVPAAATVDWCFDFTNMKFWFRVNGGNWNGDATANPVTNTNGRVIGHSGVFMPYIRLTGVTATATLNPSPGSLQTGFTAWDVPTPTRTSMTVIA